jgi:ParB family chromosome partitioning protein
LDTLPVDRIIVGDRHRIDLGDIDALAASIDDVGLLHPIVVNTANRLIAGRRRLEAVRKLGWDEVPVHVVGGLHHALAALRAERDENTCRKEFTPSEAVAIGKALEELERPKARERKAQAAGRPRGSKKAEAVSGGNLPQQTDGKTRDKVAEAVGMSGRTYEKAKAVVDAAATEPGLQPVLEEMDRTGKVEPAYKKVKGGAGARGRKDAEPRADRGVTRGEVQEVVEAACRLVGLPKKPKLRHWEIEDCLPLAIPVVLRVAHKVLSVRQLADLFNIQMERAVRFAAEHTNEEVTAENIQHLTIKGRELLVHRVLKSLCKKGVVAKVRDDRTSGGAVYKLLYGGE